MDASPNTAPLGKGRVSHFVFGGIFLAPVAVILWRTWSTFDAGGPRWFDPPADERDLFRASGTIIVLFGVGAMALLSGGVVYPGRGRVGDWERGRRERPEQPWTWRADWRQRAIEEDRRSALPLLLYAIVCAAGAAPSLDAWRAQGADYIAVASVVAAAVAVGLSLWAAGKALLQRRGIRPVLRMAGETGVLGGPLEAAIVLGGDAPDEVAVRLLCEETRLIEERNRNERRYREKMSIRHDESRRVTVADGGLAAVRFAIPRSLSETSREGGLPKSSDGPPRVDWAVEVSAADGGRLARFIVPVFETPESRDDFALPPTAADERLQDDTLTSRLRREGIAHTQHAGLHRYEADRFRRPDAMFGDFCMAAILFGLFVVGPAWIAYAIAGAADAQAGFVRILLFVVAGIPALFAALFAIGCAAIVWGSVTRFFERRVLTADRDGLTVERSLFGLRFTRTARWDRCEKVRFGSGQRSGRYSARDVQTALAGWFSPSFVLLKAVTTETGEAVIAELEELRIGAR